MRCQIMLDYYKTLDKVCTQLTVQQFSTSSLDMPDWINLQQNCLDMPDKIVGIYKLFRNSWIYICIFQNYNSLVT